MTTVCSLRDVQVVRDGRAILDTITWEVDARQRWVIMGPNGAGKTTLLSVLASLTHPSSGEVQVLGETVGKTDVFELRPRVGFASSEMARRIPGNEKVLDAVMTASHAVTGRWRENYDDVDIRRATRVLGEWNLDHMAERLVGTLSDGERKRVQIARSVMTDPELLLLDEPAGSLDVGGREDVVELLNQFAAWEGAPAMVMVTHHLEEIPPAFTHAMLLREGAVVAMGPIADVLTSEQVSLAFGRALTVTHSDGRFRAVSAA